MAERRKTTAAKTSLKRAAIYIYIYIYADARMQVGTHAYTYKHAYTHAARWIEQVCIEPRPIISHDRDTIAAQGISGAQGSASACPPQGCGCRRPRPIAFAVSEAQTNRSTGHRNPSRPSRSAVDQVGATKPPHCEVPRSPAARAVTPLRRHLPLCA